MKGLSGRVFVLAGAGEIASATAVRLGTHGAKVVVGDINLDHAVHAAKQVEAAGGEARSLECDISEESAVRALMDFAVAEFGGINGLFNVAADLSDANLGRDTDALDIPVDVWRHTLDVNLTGYLLTIRHALPAMLAAGGGPIVNTISGATYLGEPARVAYAASKAGVTALTRHVATRWGKEGIRCNAVAPGLVLTETAVAQIPTDQHDAALQLVRLTRHGRPDDIAAMVTLLLSDDGAWITGQSYGVDGGLVLR